MIDTDKLKLLHAIRGGAALAVVICHAKYPFWSGGSEYVLKFPASEWNALDYLIFGVDMLTSNGTAMVILFFLLSGFFIAYSFHKNNWSYADFYINRFLRIYIPYFFSIIFSVATMLLAKEICPILFSEEPLPREYNIGLAEAYLHLFDWESLKSFFFILGPYNYIGYNYPYWSLLVEVLFYAAVPLIIFRKKTFAFFSIVLFILYFFIPFNYFLLTYVCKYSFYFAAGFMLFDAVVINKKVFRYHWMNINFLNTTSISLIIGGQFISLTALREFSYLLTVSGGGLLIYRILNYPVKNNYLTRALINLGSVSYSLYLIHVPFFILLYAIYVRYSGNYYSYSRIYWIAVILFIPVGYLFHYAVERRSIKLIAEFKKKVKTRKDY